MKMKHMKIPFFISMVVILFAKVYQIFLADKLSLAISDEQISIGLFCLAAVSFLVMWLLTFKTKDVKLSFSFSRNKVAGLTGILSGLALFGSGAYELYNYIKLGNDNILLLLGIFGLAAGLVLICMSISFFKERNILQKAGIFALIPVIWGIFRLLQLFFSYYSIANKIWSVPDEFAVIFLLSFLLNQARIFGNIDHPKKYKRLVLSGLTAVIFIFLYTIGAKTVFMPVDIILAVYIVCTIGSIKMEKANDTATVNFHEDIMEPITGNTTVKNYIIPTKVDDKIEMDKVDEIINDIQREDSAE